MKRIYKVYKKTVSIVNETPTAMYENLVGSRKGFLLESYDKNYDRYTFLGEPEELISSEGESLVITKKSGEREVRRGNPLALLKEYYDEFEIHKENDELNFSGGLVGNVGYDFIRYSEKLPEKNPDEIGIETIQLMLMKAFIVMDYVAETLTAVVLEEETEEGRKRAGVTAEELIRRAMHPEQIEGGCDSRCEENTGHGMKEAAQPEGGKRDGVIRKKSDTLAAYSAKVEKIRHYIREGHIFQTVLSQRWTVETGRDGFSLYKELRELNPSPYLYYFQFGDFEVIGSSPEMLVKQQGKRVFTCPIAGTRPRGKTVDIVSMVEGRKKGSYHPFDLLSSFLPAGTLSGAPKIRAMEIIEELEKVRRGLYGGATGYVDFSGDMDFCITIRTMIKKGREVYLQAGAGIVADSVPEKEYQECCNKVMALARTLLEEENL